MDCRVLPKYDLDLLMDFIKEKATEFTNTTGIKVNIKPVQKEQAPHPTSTNSEVYKILNQTIMKILGKEGNRSVLVVVPVQPFSGERVSML
jgi:hypothetical protein